jgi:hypothetical protein
MAFASHERPSARLAAPPAGACDGGAVPAPCTGEPQGRFFIMVTGVAGSLI